jgi:hypothetical protein
MKLGKDNHVKQIKYMGNTCLQTFNIILPNTNAYNTLSYTIGVFEANGLGYEKAWAIGETYGLFQDHHFIFESAYDYCVGSLTRNGTTYFGNQDPIGLKENSFDLSDNYLHPNPASTKVILPEIEGAHVKVYNSLGQLVLSAENQSSIDVSSFSNGIYLLTLENSSFKISKKLVVEH